VGVPPLVGVGVKVTDVPEQTVEAEAPMLTAGVKAEFTVMVTGLEVAVGTEAQGAVEVITQDTTSPFASVVLVKVEAVEAFTPFTIH
jgi:hypothetical protein